MNLSSARYYPERFSVKMIYSLKNKDSNQNMTGIFALNKHIISKISLTSALPTKRLYQSSRSASSGRIPHAFHKQSAHKSFPFGARNPWQKVPHSSQLHSCTLLIIIPPLINIQAFHLRKYILILSFIIYIVNACSLTDLEPIRK